MVAMPARQEVNNDLRNRGHLTFSTKENKNHMG